MACKDSTLLGTQLFDTGHKFCEKFYVKPKKRSGSACDVEVVVELPDGIIIDPDASVTPTQGTWNGTDTWMVGDLPTEDSYEEIILCFLVEDACLVEPDSVIEATYSFGGCTHLEKTIYKKLGGINCCTLSEKTGIFIEPGSNIEITGTGTEDDPYVFNGCCLSFDPLTGELTINNADGTNEVHPIITAIQAGNNVTISGSGSPTNPFVINSCCVVIDPNDPNSLIITDAEGNESTYTAATSTVNQTVLDGNEIASHDDGNGNIIPILETVTTSTVQNNENGTKTVTLTHEDGSVTEYCVPTCNTTVVSEAGETFDMGENCGVQEFDISTNDSLCDIFDEDGNLIDQVQGTYELKAISNPSNLNISALTSDGKVYVSPVDCTKPIAETIETCILCPDGTRSNTAQDMFTFVPPPIGEITVAKSNAVNNSFSVGDIFTWTIVVGNVGTGDISDPIITDQIPSCVTYVSDDSGVTPTVTPTSTGQTLVWDLTGTTISPNSSISIDLVVDTSSCTAGVEFLSNIVTAEGDDGTGTLTVDSDIDVLNETQDAEARVDSEFTDPGAGDFTLTPSFTKEPLGATIGCGEPYRMEFRTLSTGVLIDEITGTTCTDDYVSTGNGLIDITSFLTGSVGNGQTFDINKFEAAKAANLVLEESDDWEIFSFVGGQGSTTCPIESTNKDNSTVICRVEVSGGDNQSYSIVSDDSTTITYAPFTDPYVCPSSGTLENQLGGILGNLVSAPSCSMSFSGAGANRNYQVKHLAADEIRLSAVELSDGTVIGDVNYAAGLQILLPNVAPPGMAFPSEISPAMGMANIPPDILEFPSNVGGPCNTTFLSNGQVQNWHASSGCNRSIKFITLYHSCDGFTTPIILEFKVINSY